ncbi:hypothetical protein B0813_000362 [Candidatus Fervidibacteria bacterium JGI MDM2 SSWTFF-3-K9]
MKQRRRLLHQRLEELAKVAKRICPEAEISFDLNRVEEIDAWLQVIVPDGKEEEVHDALRPLSEDIHQRDNLWIGLRILERSEVKDFELAGKERG